MGRPIYPLGGWKKPPVDAAAPAY